MIFHTREMSFPSSTCDRIVVAAKSQKFLPVGYTLGDNDVYCGRGNLCYNHIGNRRFRTIILANLDRYTTAKTKTDKTTIIYEIVDHVRATSPNGGFVRQDRASGRFYEVGDFLAREKTSQAFRDAMNNKDRSSKFASTTSLNGNTNISKRSRKQIDSPVSTSSSSVVNLRHYPCGEIAQSKNGIEPNERNFVPQQNKESTATIAIESTSSSTIVKRLINESEFMNFDLFDCNPLQEISDDQSFHNSPSEVTASCSSLFDTASKTCNPYSVPSNETININNNSTKSNTSGDRNDNDERTFDLLFQFTQKFPSNDTVFNCDPDIIE